MIKQLLTIYLSLFSISFFGFSQEDSTRYICSQNADYNIVGSESKERITVLTQKDGFIFTGQTASIQSSKIWALKAKKQENGFLFANRSGGSRHGGETNKFWFRLNDAENNSDKKTADFYYRGNMGYSIDAIKMECLEIKKEKRDH